LKRTIEKNRLLYIPWSYHERLW